MEIVSSNVTVSLAPMASDRCGDLGDDVAQPSGGRVRVRAPVPRQRERPTGQDDRRLVHGDADPDAGAPPGDAGGERRHAVALADDEGRDQKLRQAQHQAPGRATISTAAISRAPTASLAVS